MMMIDEEINATSRRLSSNRWQREEIQSIFADLEYGVEAELEEFARRLLILLTNTLEETKEVLITQANARCTSVSKPRSTPEEVRNVEKSPAVKNSFCVPSSLAL